MAHVAKVESIGLGKEGTKGTGVSATRRIPKVTGAMMPITEKAKDEGDYGTIDQVYDSETEKQSTETSMSGVLRDEFAGDLLMAAFGSVSKTGAWPDYEHAFTRKNDNDHPAYGMV